MKQIRAIRAFLFAGTALLFTLFSTMALAQSTPTVPWPPSPSVKLALNPATNKVYAVNEATNSVTVLDQASGLSKTIPVGPRPYYIAVNPTTNRVYVNNSSDASLTVIDGSTDTVLATLPLGSIGPIQINPVTNVVYVVRLTGPGTDEITYVNGATDSYYSIATQSYQPIAMAVNPATNNLYIAHYATGDVRVIPGAFSGVDHPPTVSIGVWSRPFAIAANPATNKIYAITEDARGPIAIIDGATNAATFPAITPGHAVGPRAIALNAVTNKIYTAFKDELIVIDGATGGLTYIPLPPTGSGPIEIGINHQTNKIYVATDTGALIVVDGRTNLTSIGAIPTGAAALAINPVTNKVYVHGTAGVTTMDGAFGGGQPNPIVTTISPLPNDTGTSSVTFTLTATNTFVPNALPIRKVWVQLDSKNGAWAAATGSGNTYTATFNNLATGPHTLYAFATDGQDAPMYTASASMPLVGTMASYTFTVGTPPPTKVSSSVSLATSLNPSDAGQSVTFTATVSGNNGVATGTIAFRNGTTAIAGCSAVALAAGKATCTTSALAAGSHAITAAYGGDTAYLESTSGVVTQTVRAGKVASSVSLASSANPSDAGQSVTFTATVSGSSGAPTGTVAFRNGTMAIAGCTAVALSAGKATCTTSALASGTHTITAAYGGDTAYLESTSGAITQTVKAVEPPATGGTFTLFYPAAGATLEGSKQLVVWEPVKGALKYTVTAGSAPGKSDYDSKTALLLPVMILDGLPTDGRAIHIRVSTTVNGKTSSVDRLVYADSKDVAEIQTPKPLTKFDSSRETFKWKKVKDATYQLHVGTTFGGSEIASVATGDEKATVSNLPTNGKAVFVRLVTKLNGKTSFRDYAYGADGQPWGKKN